MAKATEDIWVEHPRYPGAAKRIARKGQNVPDHYLALAQPHQIAGKKAAGLVTTAAAAAPAAGKSDDGDNAATYEDMKVPELKALVEARELEPESQKKADLIAALEAADAADEAGDGEDDDNDDTQE